MSSLDPSKQARVLLAPEEAEGPAKLIRYDADRCFTAALVVEQEISEARRALGGRERIEREATEDNWRK